MWAIDAIVPFSLALQLLEENLVRETKDYDDTKTGGLLRRDATITFGEFFTLNVPSIINMVCTSSWQ